MQTNVYDIAILSLAPPTAYTDIVAMSNANNEAVIEDQRVSPAVLSVAYVDASTSFSSDLGGKYHPYSSITPAITRVVAGGKINVADGTYNEDVIIPKNLNLFSVNGRTTTIVNGQTTGWGGGALRINSSNVTVGGVGKGFTFNGKSGGAGVISFACYVSGARDNIWLEENKFVVAPRDPGNNETYALLTDGGQTNQTYKNNIFDGMSTPRFLVYVNGFADVGVPSTNIDFIGNTFATLAGGLTLSSSGGEVTGNYFQGTAGIGLNTNSSNVISGNFFQGVGSHLSNHTSSGVDVDAFIGANTFNRRVVIRNAGSYRVETFPWGTFIVVRGNIQGAINAAMAGDEILVASGTYTEGPQVVVNKNITIIGADKLTTIITPSANTGNSGDARGWFLVNAGITLNMSNVTLDGTGRLVFMGILNKGNGTIDNCRFMNIKYNESGPDYAGIGMSVRETPNINVNVTNCEFSGIGRIGVHYRGPGITGTYSGNTYTGKGAGNWLDYGVEAGGAPLPDGGARIIISNNTITSCKGVASVDGSTSAGILVTTYFGPGTRATITGCFLNNNTDGIAVGYDALDAAIVVASNNDLSGNTNLAIKSTAPPVDASANWFGSNSASVVASKVSANVDYTPWLNSGTDTQLGIPGFQGDFSNLWVGAGSPQTGSTGKIQEGINLVSGSTVNVVAGIYSEVLNIDKSVTLFGANANVNPNTGVRGAETIIDESGISTGGSTNFQLIQITSTSKVVINGFKFIDNDITATGMRHLIYIPTSATHEIKYNIFSRAASTSISSADPRAITITPSATGTITVDQNLFLGSSVADLFNNKGWRRGVWSDGGGIATTITNNVFKYCRSAINLDSYTAAASITGNTFQENGTALSFGLVAAGNYTISGNAFNNAASSTVINLSGGIDPSAFFDATANTYDGLSPSLMTLDQLFALEYRMVHRMNTGKSGFVLVKASNVYVVPALYGKTGSIQGGVDAASSGWTVNVAAGTYEEQVEINKSLNLLGQSMASTIIKSPVTLTKSFSTGPNNFPIVYVHDAPGVMISNFTVDGFGRGNANYRFIGIAYRNAGGTVSECTIKDVRNSPIDGAQHGVGLYANANDGNARSFNANNNTIFGFQKNGTVFTGANLTVSANGNTITGAGAINFIAQNGIQIYGAAGSASGNHVTGFSYTPASWTSTGMLIYNTLGSVSVTGNTVSECQTGIYFINAQGTIFQDTVTNTLAGMGTTPYWWGIVADPGIGKSQLPQVSGFDVLNETKSVSSTSSITALTTAVDSNVMNGGGNGTGIEADALGTETLNFSAHQNTVTNWGTGFVLYKEIGATLNGTLRRNSITGNKYGVLDQTGVLQDAKENWWGSSTGPADPKILPNIPNYNNTTGIGDTASSYIDYNPWYLDAPMTTLSIYNLVVNVSNGSVDVNPLPGPYNHGTIVTLTPTASEGYHFVNWSGDVPTGHETDNPLSVIMEQDRTITANFTINTYTLTVDATNGTIDVNPPTGPYNHGATVTLSPMPATGYRFTYWSGTVATGHEGDNPLILTMDSDKNIAAHFALKTYLLNITATNGTVSKTPNLAAYDSNATVILTPYPDIAYNFFNWTGHVPLGHETDNPLTLVMDGDKNITANFAIKTYTITSSVTGNGTITPSGDVNVNYGANQSFTISTNPGHHLDSVVVDGENRGVIFGYTFTNVQANHTIKAYIAANPTIPTYVISASTGSNGSIFPSGNITVDEGENQSFTITSDPHYHIDSLYVDGLLVTTTSNYSFIDIHANHTIRATFSIDTYTLSITINGSGSVTKYPDLSKYGYGSIVQLTAIPQDLSWKFSVWSGDAGGSINPLSVTMDGDKDIGAAFIPDSLYLISYRSFTAESLALERDNKNIINKFVQKKPDKVEFNCIVHNNSGKILKDLHFHFTPTLILDNAKYPFTIHPVPSQTIYYTKGFIKFIFDAGIPDGDSVEVHGWGSRGKLMTSTYSWREHVAGLHLPTTFTMNQLRYPLPNRVNALYESFRLNGFRDDGGLLVGEARNDAPQQFGWMLATSYTDVLKTLYSKRFGMHTGDPQGFGNFTSSNRPIKGRQKSIPPTKQNNKLLADLVALKVNIAASQLEITPFGFRELIYNDGTSNILNDKSIIQIETYGDSIMMGFYEGGIHKFADTSVFNNLDRTVRKINSAFEGALDTISFATSLKFKGVRTLMDVSYLKPNPSAIPMRIIPDGNGTPELPQVFTLYQNYPNPFNPTTTIGFDLPVSATVTLKIYNILGQGIMTIFDHEVLDGGYQEVEFQANGIPSGVYFYKINAEGLSDEDDAPRGENFLMIKKMMLLK